MHAKCSGLKGKLKDDQGYVCPRCHGLTRPIDGQPLTEVVVGDQTLDVVDKFCYLGDTLSSVGCCTSAWGKFRDCFLS